MHHLIRDLMPPEVIANYNKTVKRPYGKKNPHEFQFCYGPLFLLEKLIPNKKLQARGENSEYLAVPTYDSSGKRYDVYLRRAFKDLDWRERGITKPKGFTIEARDDDNFNLRTENLIAVPSKQTHRKNSWMTHYLIGIRLDAFLQGSCPDEAMAKVIARNKKAGGINV